MHPATKRNLLLHLQSVQKDIKAAIASLKSDHPLAAMANTNLAVADAKRAQDAFVSYPRLKHVGFSRANAEAQAASAKQEENAKSTDE